MEDAEIKVEDYGDFTAGVNTIKTLNADLDGQKEEIETCKNTLEDAAVFMGPVADSTNDSLMELSNLVTLMTSNFIVMGNLLTQVGNSFKETDSNAAKYIQTLEDGNFKIVKGPVLIESGNKTQDEAYLFLKRKGFSDAAICGILSNIEYESGFQTDVDGDGGYSHGLCQWYSGRNESLRQYCKDNNLELNSVEGQLEYMIYELETNPRFSEVYDTVKNAPNTKQGAYDVAHIWTMQYEVPDNASSKAANRADAAQNKYWDLYGPK